MPFTYNLHAKRACFALLNAAVLTGAVSVATARQTPPSSPPAKPQPPAPASTPEEPVMDMLYKAGVEALNKADLSAAEKAFQAGLDKAQATKNEKYNAKFLSGLSVTYYNSSQFEQALDCGSRALAIREKLGSPQDMALSLNILSAVYLNLGQFEQALDCGSRALAIREKLGSPQDMALPLNNLGNIYYTLGQFEKSLDYYNRALSLFEERKDTQNIPATLNNLGSVYNHLDQMEKSLACYNRARSLFEAANNPRGIAFTLNNLGNVYYSVGQFPKARDYYNQALAIRKGLENRQDVAATLTNLGAAYYGLGGFDMALDYYHQALVIKEEQKSPQNTVVILNNLGNVFLKLNRMGEAQAAFDKAIQKFESVSLEVGDPAQVGALQNTLPLYAGYAGLRLRQQQPGEALALLERGRAQGLTRQLAQSRVDYAALFSPGDAARWRDANTELTVAENLLGAAENRLARVAGQAGTPEGDKHAGAPQKADIAGETGAAQEQQQAKQREETAERQLTILRMELRQRYPQFRQMNGTASPTPAQIAALARRHPDTLFLQWAVTDDETLLLAMGQKDGVRGFRIPQTTQTLRDKARDWRDAIEAAGKLQASLSGIEAVRYSKAAQSEPRCARDLYHLLFDPLTKAGLLAPGRYRRLVLVGDGPLLYLPLAALVTDTGSGKSGRLLAGLPERLLDRYAVSNSVSFAVLDWPTANGKSDLPLFCVADTADGTKPERFGGRSAVSASLLPANGQGSGDSSPFSLRAGYAPLKYARREGREIVGMFPGAVGLAGPLAREAVVRETMRHADILHFAVHNTPDIRDAMRSWLLLAREDANSSYDGRLEAREVASMRLSARMAVLSACESGRGQQRGGDGLIGMAWAFRGANCPCVVAAQWKINDATSCSLMTRFYRSLLAGYRKDEAMRMAMQAVRREGEHQSPFFWAGFEVIGDTTPLFPQFPLTAEIERNSAK